MDNEMGRLIIVPQYPTKLRYQEWWFKEFPQQLIKYFDEIIVLGTKVDYLPVMDLVQFAPTIGAVEFELFQISGFLDLELQEDDTLLFNDLSFPGLFPQVLFHKRPKKCFAICHGTSKNSYDYFAKDRVLKYPIERTTAKLFNKVFVATYYHANKLGWKNILVTGLPMPPFKTVRKDKIIPIINVSRNTIQKRTKSIEEEIEKAFHCKIYTPEVNTWDDYYEVLSKSKVMLITSKEETFGYQVVDAILNGCIPVAPNHFSYPELIPKNYLYNNINELITILIKALGDELPVPQLLREVEYRSFYHNLAKYMQQ